jgi:ribose-phosphate pyrophosphokinase
MAALKIFSGNANKKLASMIADNLGVSLGHAEVRSFPDSETRININENVRGCDVFIVQPTSNPVNTNVMELLQFVDAVKRASAKRITAVIPYFGYARQDRKDQPRVSITAKLVANLITTSGADRVLTIDLHAGQIQGFFDIPLDNLYATPVLEEYFKKNPVENCVVVSPDIGAIKRAQDFANRLGTSIAIIDKRRPKPGVAEAVNIIGQVKDKNVIMYDDMVDTGGSVIAGTNLLKEKGAKDIYFACTHGVLSANAIQRIEESPLVKMVITDTIPLQDEKVCDKIEVRSISHLLAQAIDRIHNETSISTLFI